MVSEFPSKSELFQELMAFEIREILLISSVYNIFNMEGDDSLTSKIIKEYKGLNLFRPPVITGVSSVSKALALLHKKDFDMVLIVLNPEKIDVFSLAREIKNIRQNLPIILLSPFLKGICPFPANTPESQNDHCIDKIFIWSGNSDLLLALVKNAEDHLNVEQDTKLSNVRVLILVEDSPEYYSIFLPIIYKEVVTQTQALLRFGLNDTQKLITIRKRPKILLARSYEEAMAMYQKYRASVLCVISDTRLPRKNSMDAEAGIAILTQIRKEIPKIPLLLMSSESANKEKAKNIASTFIDKNAPDLLGKTRDFFRCHLGFGDFVFRMPDGREIGRAPNFLQFEAKLAGIPDESIAYHIDNNHFSNWLMAGSEIDLGLQFRSVKSSDFSGVDEIRQYIISKIHDIRKSRQKGIVSKFDKDNFDSDIMEFVKIGEGSMGGKARGLAFMSVLLTEYEQIQKKYPDIAIKIPKTLVIATDVFETFVIGNDLQKYSQPGIRNDVVAESFLNADLPGSLIKKLDVYLAQVKFPLAVRSSSQLEDAHDQPFAGLYRTYKIPNNDPDPATRLAQLSNAVKLVYASLYFEDAKAFAINTSASPFDESMAVIIQEVTGDRYGDFFYPAISGVAQSTNYYPVSHMKADEGVAHIALGFGKTVVDGEKCLRFSPKYPNNIPQFSIVGDMLKNTQPFFYALRIKNYHKSLNFKKYTNLEKRSVSDAGDEFPLKALASTYVAEENRIRDTWHMPGAKVLTFAHVLKYDTPPMSPLLRDLLELGTQGLGGPVEIEFSMNLYPDTQQKSDFYILQIRPMAADDDRAGVEITQSEIRSAFCCSCQALGNGVNETMADIVYIKPDDFKPDATVRMAEEIKRMNAGLLAEKRPYLLVGPGRWGASDRWLGIPVKWQNISGVSAIIELKNEKINADPTQGSHFFHNITSQGIHYITVNELSGQPSKASNDFFDWKWIDSLPAFSETEFVRHVRLAEPLLLKINGKKSQAVMIRP